MDKLNSSIETTLNKLEISFPLVEPKLIKHLQKIEQVLESIFARQETLLTEIKNNKPSLLKISTEANIARQTLYNNPILKAYIEFRIEEYNVNDISNKNQILQDKIKELNDVIEKMQVRDVNIELLKHEVTSLKEELKINKKETLEWKQKYNNLLKKKEEPTTAPLKKDIIKFPSP